MAPPTEHRSLSRGSLSLTPRGGGPRGHGAGPAMLGMSLPPCYGRPMRKRPSGRDTENRFVYSTGGEAGKAVSRPSAIEKDGVPRAASGKGVRVRLERRPGGRDITTVLGLVGAEAALSALAAELRAACGAGGTVRDGVVELQGDQCDKVRRALAERGIKSR